MELVLEKQKNGEWVIDAKALVEEVEKYLKDLRESKGKEIELHREGFLEGISRWEIFDIPLGSAIGGMFTAGLWDILASFLSGLTEKLPDWLVPLLGAWVSKRFISRLVGAEAANVAAIILTYEGLARAFNVREWVSGLAGRLKERVSGEETSSSSVGEIASLEEYNRLHGI